VFRSIKFVDHPAEKQDEEIIPVYSEVEISSSVAMATGSEALMYKRAWFCEWMPEPLDWYFDDDEEEPDEFRRKENRKATANRRPHAPASTSKGRIRHIYL
jgi:hypothetical protein